MQHTISLHTRLAHFLVTIDETVNNDIDLEDQIPLADIWSHQKISEKEVAKLQTLTGSWKYEGEDESLFPDLRQPGVYRLGDLLVIVGLFDNGNPSGAWGVYHWVFRKA